MDRIAFAYETYYKDKNFFKNIKGDLDVILKKVSPQLIRIVFREDSNILDVPLDIKLITNDNKGEYLKRILNDTDAQALVRIKMLDVPLSSRILEKFVEFSSQKRNDISYADFDDIGFFGSFMEFLRRDIIIQLDPEFRLEAHKDRVYYINGLKKRSYWFDFEDRVSYFDNVLPDRYRIPGAINIESASRCILRCKMCWTGGEKYKWMRVKMPSPFMELDCYHRILQQISEIYKYEPAIISLIYRGEPLLNKHLPKMIEDASKMNLRVIIITNAMLLTEDLSAKLIDAGLWEIVFSVNSHDEKTYHKIQIGGDFERVMSNINSFLNIRSKAGRKDLRVSYRAVYQKDNESQIDEMIDHFFTPDIFNISFQCEILRPNAPKGGGQTWKRFYRIPQRVPCWNLWWNCTITTEGNVLPCVTCTNELEDEVMGNVKEDHLFDIWHDEIYNKYRELHLSNQIDKVPFCKNCDQYEVSNWSNDPEIYNNVEDITYPAVRVFRRIM